jgi:hypothetical protein
MAMPLAGPRALAIRFNVENVLDTNYWSMITFNTREPSGWR